MRRTRVLALTWKGKNKVVFSCCMCARLEYVVPAPAEYWYTRRQLAQAVSYAAQAQVLEYFAPASSAYAGPFATATGSFILSLSCPPSTFALVVEYIAPAPAVYAAPAPVMVYIALAQALSYAAQAQVLEYFAPASSAYAGRSANCNREFHSLPVVPTVYTCTYGGVHRAGTSSLCCTCACHGVHRAPRESIPYVLSSARSFVQETGQRSRF